MAGIGSNLHHRAALRCLTALCLLLSALSVHGQSSETDQFVIFPLFGYSDEAGMAFGAQAAWINIDGTPWALTAAAMVTTLYNRSFLYSDITNRKLMDLFYVKASGFFNKSSRSLFYGFGNDSSVGNVSQYSINDSSFSLRAGVNIMPDAVIGLSLSHRSAGIDVGSDPTLPQYFNLFPMSPRLSGTTSTMTGIFVMYDTRTPEFSPQQGILVFSSLEQAQPRAGEDLSQQRFVLRGQYIYVIEDKELILVSQAKYEHNWGENIPFFLQSSLGGENSIRAYRSNRFIDVASQTFNFEPRWTFWTPAGSLINRFELSLAYEFGRVFNAENIPPYYDYHPGYDLGLTALLTSGIPVRFDYAFGPESSLIYLHLFYPF